MFKASILLRIFICLCLLLKFPFSFLTVTQVVITDTGSSVFPERFMNASGTVITPVIPIQFADISFGEDPIPYLKEVFTGSGSTCGGSVIPSVKNYFSNASYGKLVLEGRVQPVVTLPGNRDDYSSKPDQMIKESLTALDSMGVDLSQFDVDKNGILDGLYLVWAGQEEGFYSDWWPNSDTFYFDYSVCGFRIGSYSSLCYKMLKENSTIRQFTAIHETGHQLGLTDYYQNGNTSGTGSSVMMDLSSGDEDCFSKILLGWISPTIADQSGWYTLPSASLSSSAVLIPPSDWDGNILSEYFLLEYITPQGNQSSLSLSSEGAVRLWHVNAATSRFTNDITPGMYKYDNRGTEPYLLRVYDTSKPWLYPGNLTDHLSLSDGTTTDLSVYIQSLENGMATVFISRDGHLYSPDDIPAYDPDTAHVASSSEAINSESVNESGYTHQNDPSNETDSGKTSESSIKEDDPGADLSELSSDSDQVSTTQSDADPIGDEENTEVSKGVEDEGQDRSEDRSEGASVEESNTHKQLTQTLPMFVPVIAVFVLCFFLLKTPKKKKHSRKKKR